MGKHKRSNECVLNCDVTQLAATQRTSYDPICEHKTAIKGMFLTEKSQQFSFWWDFMNAEILKFANKGRISGFRIYTIHTSTPVVLDIFTTPLDEFFR